MSITVEAVKAALAAVIDPNTGRDLVSGKSAKNIQVDGNDVAFDVELGYPAKSQIDPIRRAAIAARQPRARHHMMTPVTDSAAGSTPPRKMSACSTHVTWNTLRWKCVAMRSDEAPAHMTA